MNFFRFALLRIFAKSMILLLNEEPALFPPADESLKINIDGLKLLKYCKTIFICLRDIFVRKRFSTFFTVFLCH